MKELIDLLVNSQAPWMVLSGFLVVFIVKLQNDRTLELCAAVSRLALLYDQHDKQASEIHKETAFIREWCISKTGDGSCVPRPPPPV